MQLRLSIAEDGIHVKFEYHKKLIDKIKSITGHHFDAELQTWVIPFYSLPELEKVVRVPDNIKQTAKTKLERLHQELKTHEFQYDLRAFQYDGVLFMLERQKAFLCADMGLGKTFMSIAFSETLHQAGNIQHTIIICSSSLKHHWLIEINKFLNEMPVQIIDGDKRKRMKQWDTLSDVRFTILNYELVRLTDDFNHLTRLLRQQNCLIIIDEAARIKNFQAKTSKRIKRLRAPYKVVLSGRPLENKPEELYSINEFLDNNVFGTWPQFNRRYIVRDSWGSPSYYINLPELHHKVKSIMFRRKKEEVLKDLPAMIEHNYYVHLSSAESEDYARITQRIVELIEQIERGGHKGKLARNVLGSMTIAKMYCDHPDLVRESSALSAKSLKIKAKTSSKFTEFLSIMQEVGDQKVIVFTQYAKMAHKLYDALSQVYECTIVTGEHKDRNERMKEFEEKTQVLVCTDVLGYGVNLQFASAVINYDLPWNPAVIEQRNARVHRMGQKNTVNIVNLIVEDEDKIEQRIREVLNQKTDLYKAIIEGEFPEKEEEPWPEQLID